MIAVRTPDETLSFFVQKKRVTHTKMVNVTLDRNVSKKLSLGHLTTDLPVKVVGRDTPKKDKK